MQIPIVATHLEALSCRAHRSNASRGVGEKCLWLHLGKISIVVSIENIAICEAGDLSYPFKTIALDTQSAAEA
jgi:hypothetical protein